MAHRDPRFDIFIGGADDPTPVERSEDAPFRVALIGDFSGRAARGDTADVPAPARRVVRVDVETSDDAIAAINPKIAMTLDPASPPVVIEFSELDDFHPDRLAERLVIVQGLLAIRRDAISAPPARPAASPAGARDTAGHSPPSAADVASGSLLDLIIDASPAAGTSGTRDARPADDLSQFVRHAVRPHAIHEAAARDPALVAKIDAVLHATMRAVLHDPGFQSLEALWRGADFFLRRLDSDGRVELFLVDLTSAELDASLAPAAAGVAPPLVGLLGGSSSQFADSPVSLVVLTHRRGAADSLRLPALAACGRALGAPVLADVAPALMGVESFASEPDPDDWTLDMPGTWDALRRSDNAPYLALVLPGLMLRVPYGASADACSVVPFEEIASDDSPAAAHDAYLWGSGALAAALLIANGVATEGSPATHGTLENLPLHVRSIEGEPRATPCAEIGLGSRAVSRLLDLGLTPLDWMRDADVVRAPRIQSVALPPRPLAIDAGAQRA